MDSALSRKCGCSEFRDMARHISRSKYNTNNYTPKEVWVKSDSLAELVLLHERLLEIEAEDASQAGEVK